MRFSKWFKVMLAETQTNISSLSDVHSGKYILSDKVNERNTRDLVALTCLQKKCICECFPCFCCVYTTRGDTCRIIGSKCSALHEKLNRAMTENNRF